MCDGGIYYSSSYGEIWEAASVEKETNSNKCWGGVTTSTNGEYMIAVEDPGVFYMSVDYGEVNSYCIACIVSSSDFV